MWAQMNALAIDGTNVIGINLPHIVFQPLEGQVQCKTDDVTPVYWFHYTPDALVVAEPGIDWVDGTYCSFGVPKSTPADVKKRLGLGK